MTTKMRFKDRIDLDYGSHNERYKSTTLEVRTANDVDFIQADFSRALLNASVLCCHMGVQFRAAFENENPTEKLEEDHEELVKEAMRGKSKRRPANESDQSYEDYIEYCYKKLENSLLIDALNILPEEYKRRVPDTEKHSVWDLIHRMKKDYAITPMALQRAKQEIMQMNRHDGETARELWNRIEIASERLKGTTREVTFAELVQAFTTAMGSTCTLETTERLQIIVTRHEDDQREGKSAIAQVLQLLKVCDETMKLREFPQVNTVNRTPGKFKCYICNEPGHYARNCPTRRQGGRQTARNGRRNGPNNKRENGQSVKFSTKSKEEAATRWHDEYDNNSVFNVDPQDRDQLSDEAESGDEMVMAVTCHSNEGREAQRSAKDELSRGQIARKKIASRKAIGRGQKRQTREQRSAHQDCTDVNVCSSEGSTTDSTPRQMGLDAREKRRTVVTVGQKKLDLERRNQVGQKKLDLERRNQVPAKRCSITSSTEESEHDKIKTNVNCSHSLQHVNGVFLVEKGVSKRFIHDSGSCVSIVNQIQLLEPGSYQATKKKFKSANGTDLVAKLKGNVMLIPQNGRRGIRIPAVLINQATTNIIASWDLDKLCYVQLTKEGRITCSAPKKPQLSFIQNKAGAYIFNGRAKLFNGPLKLPKIINESPGSVLAVTRTREYYHKLLGHPSEKLLEQMATIWSQIPGLPASHKECVICAGANLKKIKTKHATAIAYKNGEAISCDLLMYPKGMGNFTCAAVIVDESSNYVMVTLLKHKNVLSALRDAIIKCERSYGVPVKVVRIDLGSENTSHEVGQFLRGKGIEPKFAAVQSHANPVVEVHIKLLKEITRALILEAGVPEQFWPYALKHAANLLNLRPSRKSPFASRMDAFYRTGGYTLANLHIFGQEVYYHATKFQNKLAPKGRRAMYLGTQDTLRNCVVYDLETNAVTTVASVWAPNEAVFPLKREHVDRGPEVQMPLRTTEVPKRKYVKSGKYKKSPATKKSQAKQPEDAAGHVQVLPGSAVSSGQEKEKKATAVPESAESSEKTLEQEIPEVGAQSTNEKAGHTRLEEQVEQQQLVALLAPKMAVEYDIPNSFHQAMQSAHAECWKRAITKEYDGMVKHGVFELGKKKQSDVVLPSMLLLNIKLNEQGKPDIFKARTCVNGSKQQPPEQFAPVANIEAIRILLGYAMQRNYEISHVDVSTAYYYGKVQERLCFTVPQGFYEYLTWPKTSVDETHAEEAAAILANKRRMREEYDKLGAAESTIGIALKGIPGSRTAGYYWWLEIEAFFEDRSFSKLKTSESIFVRSDPILGDLIAIVYVDDIILMGVDIKPLLREMRKSFDIKESELKWYLGLKFDWDKEGQCVRITQKAFAESILREFKCTDMNPKSVPLRADLKLSKLDSPPTGQSTKFPLARFVGQVLYLARMTRPDIILAVKILARFVGNPGDRHAKAAKHLMGYLSGTLDKGITIDATRASSELVAFADSEFANLDIDERKSYGAYMVYFCGGPAVWNVERHPRPAGSTSVAEYYTLSRCGEKVMWIRELLCEVNKTLRTTISRIPPTVVFEDNNTALNIANGVCKQKHTKHIEVRYHIVQDFISHGDIKVVKIDGKLMMVDAINKALGPREHRDKTEYLLGTKDISALCVYSN